MPNLKPDIEVTVDASQAKAGFNEVGASAKTMADVVTRETTRAGRGVDKLGGATADTGQKLDRSTKAYVNSLQRVIAAEQAGGRSTVEYQRLLAQQRGVPESVSAPLLAQFEAVKRAQEAAKSGMQGLRTDLSATGLTAKQTAAALRQVPAQFTDIVVSLQGGTAPLTVFLQQGGQLKDVFGSAGAAARALGGYVLGLINPFTVLAAAVALVALAYKEASDESDAFTKAIILTGNASGQTVDSLRQYQTEVAKSTGATKGLAAEALELAVASGVTGANIGKVTEAAIRMQREAGVPLEKTIKQFVDLQKEPLKAALALNEGTNFLTAALYEQIKALEDQGRGVEASTIIVNAHADALKRRTAEIKENLGKWQEGYREIGDAIKYVVDNAKELFRGGDDAFVAQEQRLRNRIATLRAGLGGDNAPTAGSVSDVKQRGELAALEAGLAVLVEQKDAKAAIAQEEERSANAVKLKARFDQRGLQYLDEEAKKRAAIIKLQGQLQEEVDAGAISFKKAAEQLDAAKRSMLPKNIESIAAAQLEADVKKIENALKGELRAYAVKEQATEALRAAGIVGEGAYYDAKRGFLELTTEAQKTAIERELDLRRGASLKDVAAIENAKKINDLIERRNELLIQAGGSRFVLGIQQQSALDTLARSFLQARQAAEAYLATAERGFARELQGVGRSDRARGESQNISAIEERFLQRRREIENTFKLVTLAGPPTSEIAAKYANDLAILEEFQGKEVAAFRNAYTRKLEAEADWRNGVTRGLENYVDSVANTAGSVESLLTSAFKSAEDAFVEFAKTGQLSFSKMADGIITDLIRIGIQKRITGPLAEGLFGGGGGGGGSGADGSLVAALRSVLPFATGGVVDSPSLSKYSNQVLDKPTFFAFAKGGVAGEAGPEAIMPLTRGPDGNLGVRASGGGTTINIIESNEKAGEVDRRNTSGGETIDVYVARIAKGAVASDIRSGRGEVASAMQSTFGVNRVAGAY